MYFANPGPASRVAMRAGLIGAIGTPAQSHRLDPGVTWCADNGAFSEKWDAGKWWAWLERNAVNAGTCVFAALPDVVADWPATLARSLPWLPRVKGLGYRVAIVLQDGATADTVPWDDLDAVFIGGGRQFAYSRRYGLIETEWKLGPHARMLIAEAKRRGLWVHMGRVNSERRLRYAGAIGCDSADGTYLTFGPDVNLPKVLDWLRGVNDQSVLDFGESA